MDEPEPDPANTITLLVMLFFAVFAFLTALSTSSVLLANEKRISEKAEDGDKKATRVLKLLEAYSCVSDTATVSSILSGMFFVIASTIKFLPFFKENCFGIIDNGFVASLLSHLTIVLITAIVFISLCVILPSRLGSQHSDRLAPRFSLYTSFICTVMTPITWFITLIARIFVFIFGGDPHYDEAPVTEDEILSMVDEGEEKGVIEESQKEMINNIFEFDDLTAGDVMTHRTHIEAVETTEDIASVVNKAIEEGYSRLPVYENDLDNIKGILYVKDLLKYVGNSIPADLKPADIMREAMFIPESKKCRDVFSEMTEKHLQMMVVADEYGGVAGVVTIEDLLESIVGNIQDEFDDEEEEIEQISEDIFNVDGASDIGDIEELLDIKFPEGEYDTVAGYVMSVLGRIPETDEHPTIEYEGFAFYVSETEDRRIVRIMIERLPEPIEEEEKTEKAKKEKPDKI